MIKMLLAFTFLTLSLGVNAAAVEYRISDGEGISGSFKYDFESDEYSDVAVSAFYAVYDTLIGTGRAAEGAGENVVSGAASFITLDFETILSPSVPSVLLFCENYVTQCDSSESTSKMSGNANATPSAVPIPAAAWLFGSAILGLGALKRRNA